MCGIRTRCSAHCSRWRVMMLSGLSIFSRRRNSLFVIRSYHGTWTEKKTYFEYRILGWELFGAIHWSSLHVTYTSADTICCDKPGLNKQVHNDNLHRAAPLPSYVEDLLDCLSTVPRIGFSLVPSMKLILPGDRALSGIAFRFLDTRKILHYVTLYNHYVYYMF